MYWENLMLKLENGDEISWKEYQIIEDHYHPIIFTHALEKRFEKTRNPKDLVMACTVYKKRKDEKRVTAILKRLEQNHPSFIEEDHFYNELPGTREDILGKTQEDMESKNASLEIYKRNSFHVDFKDYYEEAYRFTQKKRKDEKTSNSYDYSNEEREDEEDGLI
jgi:hypothetical protein